MVHRASVNRSTGRSVPSNAEPYPYSTSSVPRLGAASRASRRLTVKQSTGIPSSALGIDSVGRLPSHVTRTTSRLSTSRVHRPTPAHLGRSSLVYSVYRYTARRVLPAAHSITTITCSTLPYRYVTARAASGRYAYRYGRGKIYQLELLHGGATAQCVICIPPVCETESGMHRCSIGVTFLT